MLKKIAIINDPGQFDRIYLCSLGGKIVHFGTTDYFYWVQLNPVAPKNGYTMGDMVACKIDYINEFLNDDKMVNVEVARSCTWWWERDRFYCKLCG